MRQPQHPGVRCQYPRVEVMDALFARMVEQPTRDCRADTTRLPLVRDGNCELRARAARRGGISRHADDALCVSVSNHGDVGHRVVVIYIHHAFDEFVRRLANRVHQPGVTGGGAQATDEFTFPVCVIRADRTNDVVNWQFGRWGVRFDDAASHWRLRSTMDSDASGPLPTPRGSHPESGDNEEVKPTPEC